MNWKKFTKLSRRVLSVLLISCLLTMFVITGFASAQPTVTRSLPAVVQPGDIFDVTITFAASDNNFIPGLTDVAPAGWNVAVDVTWCDPDASFGTPVAPWTSDTVEYLWIAPYSSGTAFTAVYQVQVPGGAALGLYTFPNGQLEWYEDGSGPFTVGIIGDTQVEVYVAPAVTSVAPDSDTQGQTLDVIITGTNFTGATVVSFGAGITVNSFTVDSDTQITADITIACDAALGDRDVSVTTPGVTIPPGTGTLPDGFTVLEIPIDQAITDGMAWLAAQQNPDGSWDSGGSSTVGVTGLALVKFCDHAVGEGLSPFDSGYAYHTEVEDGFDYLFSMADTESISTQPAGNPDSDGDGIGVRIYDNTIMYETGIALMAISASNAPSREVDVPGSDVDGWEYQEVAQDVIDYIAWAQNDSSGSGRGGWDYGPNTTRGDQSISGFVALGLGYAAATPPWGFGLTIPAFVLSELDIWIDYIQNDVDGDTNDGGAGYTDPTSWVNIYKTGHLLWQMELVGDDSSTQRVQDAVDYLVRHWNDANTDPGWKGSGGADEASYQAMFSVMKGLVKLEIDTIDSIDWFCDFSNVLVDQQNPGGSWDGADWGNDVLNTTWAILTLQKAAAVTACDADFSAAPTRGPAPLTVRFTDESTGGISTWSWDFGDGGTSDDQNPSHTYTEPGTYTVSLDVSGACGRAIETKIDYIEVTEEVAVAKSRFAVAV